MFSFETRFNPYYVCVIATRQNEKKTKKEQYRFVCEAGTLKIVLDSYTYNKRDEKGHYYVARTWNRYPSTIKDKKVSILETSDVPESSTLKKGLLKYLAASIEFKPFSGVKELAAIQKQEKKTEDKHWGRIKEKIHAETEAKAKALKKEYKAKKKAEAESAEKKAKKKSKRK